MSSPVSVDVFVEDRAHEVFFVPLLLRIAKAFKTVVGQRPTAGKKKCARDHYKRVLAKTVLPAGHPATLGGIEFGSELVAGMDLYRAAKGDHSLKAFLDDLRAKLRLLRPECEGRAE